MPAQMFAHFSLLAQETGPLGDGKIDNTIIDPAVHQWVGVAVVVLFAALAAYSIYLAVTKRGFDRVALGLTIAAEAILAVQILLGIKLLDQGMGIFQLYIHYVGGLLPLGIFLGLSWFKFDDERRKVLVYGIAAIVSLLIVLMTYFIGQSFANRYA